ncbi:hypothetical protein CapIbe_005583 [Capra ibex]
MGYLSTQEKKTNKGFFGCLFHQILLRRNNLKCSSTKSLQIPHYCQEAGDVAVNKTIKVTVFILIILCRMSGSSPEEMYDIAQ